MHSWFIKNDPLYPGNDTERSLYIAARISPVSGPILRHAICRILETSSMGLVTRKCELGFSLDFADLYNRPGLEKLDDAFLTHLAEVDHDLAQRLKAAR